MTISKQRKINEKIFIDKKKYKNKKLYIKNNQCILKIILIMDVVLDTVDVITICLRLLKNVNDNLEAFNSLKTFSFIRISLIN